MKSTMIGDDKLSIKGLKANSANYYAELSFDSLRFQYSNVIEAIIQSNRRMNMYFRIAGINKGSLLS